MTLGTTLAKGRKFTLPSAIEIPSVPEQTCEVDRCGVVRSHKYPPQTHNFRETSPGERNVTEVRNGLLSRENWLRCILVAKFDIEHGPLVETVVPSNSLDTSTERLMALIALPDSNSCSFGDSFFTFSIRDNQSIPLNSCATMEHSYLHAFVLYRQERNAKLRRGALQRSLVLVSHHYFPNVFYKVAKQLGPLYFENDAGVISAAWGDVVQWPAPQRNDVYVLPFAGSTLHIMISKLFDTPSSSVGPHFSKVAGLNDEKAAEDAEQTTAGLWSSLPGLSEELWHLWEILLTGSPLVVYSESVCEISRAIEALRLLISPLRYFGDVRPYLTHYDPDYGELCRLNREFDTQRGLRSPIRLSFGMSGKPGHSHGGGKGNSRSKGIPLGTSYLGKQSRRQVHAIADAKDMIDKCEGGKEETGEDEDPVRTADKVLNSSRDRAKVGLATSFENELEDLASVSAPRVMDENGSDTKTLATHVSSTCSDRASLKGNNGCGGDSCHRGVLLGITSAHVLQTLRFLPNGLFLGRALRQTPAPGTEVPSDHGCSTKFRLAKDSGIKDKKPTLERRPEEPISQIQNRDAVSQRPTELPGPESRNSLVQCPGKEMIIDSNTRELNSAHSTASLESLRGPSGGADDAFPSSPRSFFPSSFVSSLLSPRASSGRTTTQVSAPSTPHPSDSVFSFSPGNISRRRVRLRSGRPLGPGNLMEVTKSRSDSVLATRTAPCIAADCSVLKLLSAVPEPTNSCNNAPQGNCCKEHPTFECQHRDHSDAQANTLVEAAQHYASQVNDEILRRYFVNLTCTFLQPFERYFRMESTCSGTVRGTNMSSKYSYRITGIEKRKGPEGDLSTCAGAGGVARRVSVDQLGQNPYIDSTNLLPSFSPSCFLEEIRSKKLPPPPFTRCGGPEGLYARFIRSPHFRPWFAERRRQALAEINVLTKGLRMATTEATLLVDRNGRRKSERRLVQLLAQVKQAIFTERQQRTPDDELVLHMKKHKTALEKAIPQDVLAAVKLADQGLQTAART